MVPAPKETVVTVVIDTPRPGGAFPVGGDIDVTGTATLTGPGVTEIATVSVRVGSGPVVAATLSPARGRKVRYRATVSLPAAGPATISVDAADGRADDGAASVQVTSTGVGPCIDGLAWRNYPVTLSGTPLRTCRPGNLAALLTTIADADSAGKQAHAFGARWSFSDCAYTDDVSVDTRGLAQPVQLVQQALLPGAPGPLVHVEAGIRIRELYGWLDSQGLAFETMGAASGQTLAGAVATGTHGGDKNLSAIGDSVLALHLVGRGGTQYWIEPTNGITDPGRLITEVARGVAPENVIYNDDVFNACLVSLGSFGVVYSVVLRVRAAYDLVETSIETTWNHFRQSAGKWLDDPQIRFVQALFSPFTDPNDENPVIVTTRQEAPFTRAGVRPSGNTAGAVHDAVSAMNPAHAVYIGAHLDLDPAIPQEQILVNLIEMVLTQFPEEIFVLAQHYPDILRQVWPTGMWRGGAHSVMDIGASSLIPTQQPGLSVELAFPARAADGTLGPAPFLDSVSNIIRTSTSSTFFAGYVSLRFSAGTRALLGGLQWPQTCSVEISVAAGVRGDRELMSRLYRIGVEQGGIPHWGQLLDLGVAGDADVYPRKDIWRSVYSRFSEGFTRRPFENSLTARWGLTDPHDAAPVSDTVPPDINVGTSRTVKVTMRNTGPFAWTVGEGVVLRCWPPNKTVWNFADVPLPTDVPPGGEAVFDVTLTAPSVVGTHPFGARMATTGRRAFGQPTPQRDLAASPIPGRATVPSVLRLHPPDARSAVIKAGLVPAFTGSGPNLIVVTQDPEAGSQVQPGSTVAFHAETGGIEKLQK